MWSGNNVPQTPIYQPIKSGDCAAVVQLHRSVFESKDIESSIFVSRQVEHYLVQLVAFPDLQREHWLWGAWLGDELVGYIFGRALKTSWHLNYLAVTASCQGSGIGHELWSRWYRAGCERAYQSFTVDVGQHNERARTWYERMGYCSIDTTYVYCDQLSGASAETAPAYQLLNWENAQAWQAQYGFSQFELMAENEKWSFGRLGEKYFRASRLPTREVRALLHRLDASRQLILLSDKPVAAMHEVKVSYRLRCDLQNQS